MKNKKQNPGTTQTVRLKQLVFIMLFVAIMLTCTDSNAQFFTKAITYNLQQRDMIAFTVSREANVRYYNIEAANDSAKFAIIAKVNSLGNTMIPRDYHYDITVAGSGYKYYRVTQVYMNWLDEHSSVISALKSPAGNPQFQTIPATSQVVATKNIQQ